MNLNKIERAMKKERLKAAIDELTSIIDEMQTEVNEFHAKKGDWYDFHLQLYRSGLMTDKKFDRDIWSEYHSMRTCFGDDLYALQRLVIILDKRYESFNHLREHLDRVVSCSLTKPHDWKEFEVEFNDSDCGHTVKNRFFAPSENYAVHMCMKYNKYDDKDVDIIKVKEVSHE